MMVIVVVIMMCEHEIVNKMEKVSSTVLKGFTVLYGQ